MKEFYILYEIGHRGNYIKECDCIKASSKEEAIEKLKNSMPCRVWIEEVKEVKKIEK